MFKEKVTRVRKTLLGRTEGTRVAARRGRAVRVIFLFVSGRIGGQRTDRAMKTKLVPCTGR